MRFRDVVEKYELGNPPQRITCIALLYEPVCGLCCQPTIEPRTTLNFMIPSVCKDLPNKIVDWIRPVDDELCFFGVDRRSDPKRLAGVHCVLNSSFDMLDVVHKTLLQGGAPDTMVFNDNIDKDLLSRITLAYANTGYGDPNVILDEDTPAGTAFLTQLDTWIASSVWLVCEAPGYSTRITLDM